jgi:histidinol phosphatase-like enzyme (inositol monophosphatase family)
VVVAMSPNAPDPARVALAEQLAQAARETVLAYFRGALGEEDKPDATPVTLADRGAERTMRERIAAAFPNDGIIGEEFGTERPDADHVWVLDPIDGTKQFITGKPTFGTLIALLRDGAPVVGVIELPAMGERWIGVTGQPTEHDGPEGRIAVRTRPCPTLARATVCTTTPETFEDGGALWAGYRALRAAARVTVYGGDCHNYGLLASGFCDVAIDGAMSVYDYAALVPVVRGAGGVITDFDGQPLRQGDARVIATGDPALHQQALAALRG